MRGFTARSSTAQPRIYQEANLCVASPFENKQGINAWMTAAGDRGRQAAAIDIEGHPSKVYPSLCFPTLTAALLPPTVSTYTVLSCHQKGHGLKDG